MGLGPGRGVALWLCAQVQVGCSAEEFLEYDLGFQAGQGCAEAVVDAAGEAEVVAAGAGDVEGVGVGVGVVVLVAVG